MNKQQLPIVVLFCTSILWGVSWFPLKLLNEVGFGSISIILLSFSLLSILMTPILISQYPQWKTNKSKLLLIAFLGGTANLTFAYALIVGDVIRVMVLFYLLPIWGVLGGRWILGETIDRRRWLGVMFAVVGALTILGGFSVFRQAPSWVDYISLAAGFFLAMTILAFRGIQQLPIASKITAMFYGCMVIALVLLTITNEVAFVHRPTSAWLALVAYSVCWLLVANVGGQWAVTKIEAGRSSIIIIMELIAAVISANLIRGEVLTPVEAIGGLLIFTAALLEALRDMSSGIKPKKA